VISAQSSKKKLKNVSKDECALESDKKKYNSKLLKENVGSKECQLVKSAETTCDNGEDSSASKHLKGKAASMKKSKKLKSSVTDESIKRLTNASVKDKLDVDFSDVSMLSAFVNKLKPGSTAEMLKDFVESHGFEVVSCRKIVRSAFGFVQFESETDLRRAVSSLSGKLFQGTPVVVALAKTKETANAEEDDSKQRKTNSKRKLKEKANRESKTLFVKNIGQSVTKEILAKEFPEAVQIFIPKTKVGAIKGYALLVYGSESLRNAALTKCQGVVVEGRKLFLDSSQSRTPHSPVDNNETKDKTKKKGVMKSNKLISKPKNQKLNADEKKSETMKKKKSDKQKTRQ